jgi:hypothetical protein
MKKRVAAFVSVVFIVALALGAMAAQSSGQVVSYPQHPDVFRYRRYLSANHVLQ